MSEVSQDDKTMGLVAHLSALVTIGPLIMWLIHKDKPERAFVTEHSKEALNFVITLWIIMIGVFIISAILGFIPVLGWIAAILIWLAMMAVGIAAFVFIILAAIAANKGNEYRYPFALRLIA
ncbi:DUF4870 domain-containing protein [Arenimonas caeni]|nr:DUF4870 domain-containing protein [Arenimonas caeni]